MIADGPDSYLHREGFYAVARVAPQMVETGGETVEVDIQPQPLSVTPAADLSIFVSCGGRPGEREVGRWLYESFQKTPDVGPFFWEHESPGAAPSRTLQQRLLERARGADGVVGFLRYRGAGQREPFSLACYDEISAAANSGVPTLVFRTPSVTLSGMVLPHLEVRSIRRVSEALPFIRSWLASVRPRSPLWTLSIRRFNAKSLLGSPRAAVFLYMDSDTRDPRRHGPPAYTYKLARLSRKLQTALELDYRAAGPDGMQPELVVITERALAELRNLRIPFYRQADGS